MSSLFKRVTLPLLAVATAAILCSPARAATATWTPCIADPDSTNGILQRVECSMTDTSSWQSAEFHTHLLGGDESYTKTDPLNIKGPGDYLDPSGLPYDIGVIGGGTYNCWCICGGGNSGGAWYVSTGGTTYVYR